MPTPQFPPAALPRRPAEACGCPGGCSNPRSISCGLHQGLVLGGSEARAREAAIGSARWPPLMASVSDGLTLPLMTQNEPCALATAPAPWFLKLALTVSGRGLWHLHAPRTPAWQSCSVPPPHAPSHPDLRCPHQDTGLLHPRGLRRLLPNSRVRCPHTSKSRESPPGGCFPWPVPSYNRSKSQNG